MALSRYPKVEAGMLIAWEIDPYVSAGALKFGMSPAEVVQILGPEQKIKRSPPHGSRYLFGRDQPIAIFDHQNLVEISFTPDVNEPVLYDQEDLFANSEKSVLQFLWQRTGRSETFEIMGFVIFFPIGIALSGFHDDDPDQKAVVCFAEGRWDRFRPRMNRIEFPSGSRPI